MEDRKDICGILKAATIMGQVWEIEKRIFSRNWRRRVWMFDTLVWTECWGMEWRYGVRKKEKG